jgi:hypothetical protein
MPSQEAETQTDYCLSDIERLEDIKACMLEERLKIQLLLREAACFKEVKKRVGDLYAQELRIKPKAARINIKV